jgi:uncharacterized membrane protein
MWQIYALVAAVLTAFLPIINKQLLKDTDVSVVAWGVNAFSLPVLGVVAYAPFFHSTVDAMFAMAVAGSGLLNLIATLVSTQALKLEDASLVIPFLTFNPIFTMLVSVFTLAEVPDVTGALGVLLIVLGAYLFAVEEAAAGFLAPVRALLKQRGVVLAILASFIWGLTPILEKIAIRHSFPENPPLVAFWTTLVMSLMLLIGIVWRRQKPLPQIAHRASGFLVAAIIAGIAPLFGFSAMAFGLIGYVTALFKLSPVITVVLARLLLKEGDMRERFLGSSVMVIGALLIASG